ncbi:MAG: 4-hydroxy-3-methylbut-2-enyl diphosphate reductase [Treponema sp.]|nr:4-hydroxy-3-methylbut-2-enyl diphosphate reductase [Treponema sp.]
MTVIRAKILGYCMGVRRAVEGAEKALDDSQGKTVYTLGPLIHNPSVMNALQSRGLKILDAESLGQASFLGEDSIVLIRAHGTTPAVLEKLRAMKVCIKDSTCPRVHISQKRAAEWSAKGFTVIIAGDKNHGEVTGIQGFANGRSVVVQTKEEASSLQVPEKAVLIAQTTFSPVEFKAISDIILQKNPGVQVFNSICSATMERQEALLELKGMADAIIVIGGKNSANTRRLYERALSVCPRAVLIEDASEIPEEFFSFKTVAITAGASTPDSIINQVEKSLQEGRYVPSL